MKIRSAQLLEDARRLVSWVEDKNIRNAIDVHLTAIYCHENNNEKAEMYIKESHSEYSRIIGE